MKRHALIKIRDATDYITKRGKRFYNTENIAATIIKVDNDFTDKNTWGYVGIIGDGKDIVWIPMRNEHSQHNLIAIRAAGTELIPKNTDVTPPYPLDVKYMWKFVFPRKR